mmetsp:Transcript_144200/g.461728  ORF Transcript_144200/g.461728 Transcript_144200/m.461728 type:complete len:227 (+) Transcript_144200:750-1430(+)
MKELAEICCSRRQEIAHGIEVATEALLRRNKTLGQGRPATGGKRDSQKLHERGSGRCILQCLRQPGPALARAQEVRPPEDFQVGQCGGNAVGRTPIQGVEGEAERSDGLAFGAQGTDVHIERRRHAADREFSFEEHAADPLRNTYLAALPDVHGHQGLLLLHLCLRDPGVGAISANPSGNCGSGSGRDRGGFVNKCLGLCSGNGVAKHRQADGTQVSKLHAPTDEV